VIAQAGRVMGGGGGSLFFFSFFFGDGDANGAASVDAGCGAGGNHA